MNLPSTARTVIADCLAMRQPPKVLLFVDDQFITAPNKQEAEVMAEKAKAETNWNEIAIMVYKPRYGGYLREVYHAR